MDEDFGNEMVFEVYRLRQDDIVRKIAETRYLEDAQAVLANWHSGHIVRIIDGKVVWRRHAGKDREE